MVALALSQIPNQINTVEKLHFWTTLVLRATYGTRSIVEAEGLLPEQMVQCPFIEAPNDGVTAICRTSIKIDPLFTTDNTKKLWQHAIASVDTTIPAAFTSN